MTRSSPASVQDAMQECVDIAMQYDDCGGEFIAQKIRDRILFLQPATDEAARTRCPHDMGFDNELGPIGCRLVGQEMECVCEHMHFASVAQPSWLETVRAGLQRIVDLKNPMPRAAVREAVAELLSTLPRPQRDTP